MKYKKLKMKKYRNIYNKKNDLKWQKHKKITKNNKTNMKAENVKILSSTVFSIDKEIGKCLLSTKSA